MSEGTIVGGESTLQIGNVVVDLISVSTGDLGVNNSEFWQDEGKRFPIPDGEVGTRFFEYAWTEAQYNAIQALIDARSYTNAKIVENNGDETAWLVLPVRHRDQVSFAGLKTVTLQFEIVNTF